MNCPAIPQHPLPPLILIPRRAYGAPMVQLKPGAVLACDDPNTVQFIEGHAPDAWVLGWLVVEAAYA